MATEIKMPPLSQTTDTVTLVDWLIAEGDEVQKGQPIADVETDKVTMQVESFTSGTMLKHVCSPGTEVPVGDIIAYIGEAGEQVPAAAKRGGQAAGGSSRVGAAPVPRSSAGKNEPKNIKATPLVRHFAEKRGVDLSLITGTGPKGLIVKADVVRYMESGTASAASASTAVPLSGIETSEKRLSRNQQAVARNMTKSVREIPQYYLKSTIYLDAVLAWRKNNQSGKKISIYSLYLYAAAKALKNFSGINGYFAENTHYVYREINIGFALAHNRDLFVPVIKGVNGKSIEEIDRDVRWLTAKAQNGKLEPDDITGGTFTVSNLGVYPVDEFSAIISPGQAAVLAVGQAGKQLIVDDHDRMQVRQAVTVTGSFDHRIVNGAEGAAFLERMKGILEKEM